MVSPVTTRVFFAYCDVISLSIFKSFISLKPVEPKLKDSVSQLEMMAFQVHVGTLRVNDFFPPQLVPVNVSQ